MRPQRGIKFIAVTYQKKWHKGAIIEFNAEITGFPMQKVQQIAAKFGLDK